MLSGIKNDRFDVESFESGDYLIYVQCFWYDAVEKHWTLANVYGPAHDNDKDSFLAVLSSFCFKAKHPLLIGGDFNILRFSSDKNKNYVDNNFSNAFNLIINIYELRELPLIGGKFT